MVIINANLKDSFASPLQQQIILCKVLILQELSHWGMKKKKTKQLKKENKQNQQNKQKRFLASFAYGNSCITFL